MVVEAGGDETTSSAAGGGAGGAAQRLSSERRNMEEGVTSRREGSGLRDRERLIRTITHVEIIGVSCLHIY